MASTKRIKSRSRINWQARAAKIRKFRTLPFNARKNFTDAQKATIRRLWEQQNYKNAAHSKFRKVGKSTAKKLKEAGFHAEETGVYLAPPTDANGNKIAGAKMKIKAGVVIQQVKERTDYTVPISKKNKERIAKGEISLADVMKAAKIPSRQKSRQFIMVEIDGRLTKLTQIRQLDEMLKSWKAKNKKTYKNSTFAIHITSYPKKKK